MQGTPAPAYFILTQSFSYHLKLCFCLLSNSQLDRGVHGGKDFVSLVISVPVPCTELWHILGL